MSYAFFPQFLLAGGELHNLCRGLQLSIRVFQPIKRQTPQCKLGRSNGDLLLGSDLICLRPLQEGFCKRKEPCQTYGEVPQWVSFFCKQTWFLLFFVGTRLPLHIPLDLQRYRYLCLLLLPRVPQPLLRCWTTTALSALGQGGPKMFWPDTSVPSTSEDSVVVVLALSPLYLWIITTQIYGCMYRFIHFASRFQIIRAISRICVAE